MCKRRLKERKKETEKGETNFILHQRTEIKQTAVKKKKKLSHGLLFVLLGRHHFEVVIIFLF
jgi:hypothetical protein